MGSTERLPSPRPHDPTSDVRVSGDVLTTNGESAPSPDDELVGTVVGGRYKVESELGRGGMGVVYKAKHLELDQEVAIKILPASYARDAETLKRFEREARTASRVRHPNVVTVFDLGRLPTGEPYLVMELLVGRDLAALVEERGTLPLAEVVDILQPIAAAIDALHLEGVVHRDIKPSNIFFTRTKALGEVVKLVDFGLAALQSTEGTERLTRVGHVVGTAVYMAPESARGELSGPLGDVYALGIVAFELLTGMVPFDGVPMAILMDKVSGPAPTLAQVTGRSYPASLEAAFATVLQRDPARRPANAVAFVDALRAALRDRASMPPPGLRSKPPPPSTTNDERPTTSSTPALPVVRRPWGLIGAAAVLVLGTVGIGAWLGTTRAPTPAPPTTAPIPAPTPAPTTTVTEPMPSSTTTPEVPALVVAPDPPTSTVAPPSITTAAVDRAPHATTARAPRPSAAPTTTAPPPTTVAAPAPPPTTAATPPSEASTSDRSAELVRQAQSAMLHGQIAAARDLYEEATQASPRLAAAWRGLGLASERLGLVPEARRAYRRYLEIAPEARDAATVQERLDHLGP